MSENKSRKRKPDQQDAQEPAKSKSKVDDDESPKTKDNTSAKKEKHREKSTESSPSSTSKQTVRLTQADAFTLVPFKGNPAAVCVVPRPELNGDEDWMLNVAAEMSLSETAFLWKRADAEYDIRWFTPIAEEKLCGHATLASAHVLFSEGHVRADQKITFVARHFGTLYASKSNNRIQLDFPALPADKRIEPSDELLQALGVKSDEVVSAAQNAMDILIEVTDEDVVARLTPQYLQLGAAVPGVRGVHVTAKSDGSSHMGQVPDFVSRCFFGGESFQGEDPVTGSAHCFLAPYWGAKLNKENMIAYQASRRGGVLFLKLTVGSGRVMLGGDAVSTMRIELLS